MRATDGISLNLLLRMRGTRWSVVAIASASIVFALSIGVFLVIRRVTGATTAPLPTGQFLATVVGLAAWAIGIQDVAAHRRFVFWSLLCVMTLFAVALSFPADRWLAWLPAIGLVAAWPLIARMRNDRRPTRTTLLKEEIDNQEKVLQQLTRLRTPDGQDAIRGTLVAEFAPGERQATLYVGFCPPFELLPQVEVNVSDDSEVDVKVAQVLHNGAQFDVRLSEPAEETTNANIEFFAIEPGIQADNP